MNGEESILARNLTAVSMVICSSTVSLNFDPTWVSSGVVAGSISAEIMAERQQFPVSEIAKAVSGAVSSVLSKINARVEESDVDSVDDFDHPLPPPKRRKKDKGKAVKSRYISY